ncbi:hypothetical protein K438DRAFT_1770915 [Mycena galopus ATCC 62051]|nr:hypothetical protein K438DRAFT_1770915 [Mycena galopus ATCC 62051]
MLHGLGISLECASFINLIGVSSHNQHMRPSRSTHPANVMIRPPECMPRTEVDSVAGPAGSSSKRGKNKTRLTRKALLMELLGAEESDEELDENALSGSGDNYNGSWRMSVEGGIKTRESSGRKGEKKREKGKGKREKGKGKREKGKGKREKG